MLQPIYSSLSAGVMLLESQYSNHPYRPLSYLFIISFFTYDSICNNSKPEYIVHHTLATIGIISSYLWPPPDKVFSTLCNVEYSTLILNMFPYIHPKFKIPLQLLFFITFFKYRIYDWYYMLDNFSLNYIQLFPIIILYALNFYWFTLMCKKLSKQLLPNVSIQHQICSYTMTINSCITIYKLYPYYSITSVLLALTKYLHNQSIIHGTPNYKKITILALHLFQVSYLVHMYTYWYILAGGHLLHIVYMNHLPTIYLILPFFLDFIVLMYYTHSVELYTNVLLQLCVHYVQPFDDLSIVGTHLLTIWYTNILIKL